MVNHMRKTMLQYGTEVHISLSTMRITLPTMHVARFPYLEQHHVPMVHPLKVRVAKASKVAVSLAAVGLAISLFSLKQLLIARGYHRQHRKFL